MAFPPPISMGSLPDMSVVRPPYHTSQGANGFQAKFGQGSRPGTTGSGQPTVGILKSSSLPILERPNSSLMTYAGGLPPGAASFQSSLPVVTEFGRPGTSQCNSWLESSMGFRMGVGPPSRSASFRSGGGGVGAMGISVQARPKSSATMGFQNGPSVSTGLEQWPARTAARARMGSLKHFTATPPRPVSRERSRPLPALTFMGIHGGQVRLAEDWHYRSFGHTQDKRIRHDHIAGDLGYT